MLEGQSIQTSYLNIEKVKQNQEKDLQRVIKKFKYDMMMIEKQNKLKLQSDQKMKEH